PVIVTRAPSASLTRFGNLIVLLAFAASATDTTMSAAAVPAIASRTTTVAAAGEPADSRTVMPHSVFAPVIACVGPGPPAIAAGVAIVASFCRCDPTAKRALAHVRAHRRADTSHNPSSRSTGRPPGALPTGSDGTAARQGPR